MLVRLPGSDVLAARAFPLACGIGSLFLFRAVARRFLTPGAVPIALGLFAMSDWLIYYASEIKQYSCDLVLTLVALLLAPGPAPPSPRRLLYLGLFGAIGVWFSHPLAFVLAGVGSYAFAAAVIRRDWRGALVLTAIGLSWAASFGACYVVSQGMLQQGRFIWDWWDFAFLRIPPHSLAELKFECCQLLNVFDSPADIKMPPGPVFTAILAPTLAIAGAATLGRRWPGGLYLLLAPAAAVLAASAMRRYPFHGRLLIFLVPAVQMLVSEGTSAIARTARAAARDRPGRLRAAPAGLRRPLACAGTAAESRQFRHPRRPAPRPARLPRHRSQRRRTPETMIPIGMNEPSAARRAGWILAAIVAVAAGLRGYQLGRLSFWYDEVVTMRLASAESPAALLRRLSEIDATRAPLHPLLLEGWIAVFGHSEAAARASSVLCGIATVWLIFDIGRVAFDVPTGLWAAWLAALSQVLIVYAREARMYAWLVLVTAFCWRCLLGRSRPLTTAGAIAYAVGLVALVYSHPLGLIMAATLAAAGWLGREASFGSSRRWLAVHLAALAMVAPWVVHYLDHAPEFLSGPLPIRFLLGTPIGYIGGNFVVLGGLALLIAWGISRLPAGEAGGVLSGQRMAAAFLLIWLIVPPSLLFVYARIFQPIFGPPRYTVFSAPAFLILVGLGLSRSPAAVRYPAAVGLTLLAALGLGPKVYDPGLKADWRGFAADLAARSPGPALVIVAPPADGKNFEVETARYYLPAGCEAIGLDEATPERLDRAGVAEIDLAVGLRGGEPATRPPERIGAYDFRLDRDYPGLRTFRAEHRAAAGGPGGGVGWRRRGGRRGGRGTRDGRLEDGEHRRVEVAAEFRSRADRGPSGSPPRSGGSAASARAGPCRGRGFRTSRRPP